MTTTAHQANDKHVHHNPEGTKIMPNTLDAPPRTIIENWMPELLDEYDAITAAQAAVVQARAAVAATLPGKPGTAKLSGPDWAVAVAADDELVAAGKTAHHCADLIRRRLDLEQHAAAVERRRDRLVAEWNRAAHTRVTEKTRANIDKAETDARVDCLTMAAEVMTAATTGPAADRITESLTRVADLRRTLDRWRELCTIQNWLTWSRPTSGAAWDPYRTAGTVPVDDTKTSQGTKDRPDLSGRSVGIVEEALALTDAKLRNQLAYRVKADGKPVVRI